MTRALGLLPVALAAALLAGCFGEAEKSSKASPAFVVETLFTHDDCTVYRFYDSGMRYFTNCAGTTTWREGCGKNCQRDASVIGWMRGETKHPANTKE